MAELLTLEALFTLFMLILLQAVLGFDNLLYIAIESNKVGDPQDARKVRKWGIALAVMLRIVLLFLIVKLFALLAEPLFNIGLGKFIEGEFTAQALITLVGGGFIIYTAIKEIHHLLQVDHIEHSVASVDAANIVDNAGVILGQFTGSIVDCKAALIADPIVGAVGCEPTKTYQVPLMVIAILLSGLAMILLADRVTEFLKKNRMYQVFFHLKLFGFPIDAMSKSSFYLVVGVLIVTDVLSNRYQKRLWAQKEAEIRGTSETAGREAVDEWKATH